MKYNGISHKPPSYKRAPPSSLLTSINLPSQVKWRYSLNVTWSFVSPFFLLGYKFTVGTWRTWLIRFCWCWWDFVVWPIDLMGTGDISEDFPPLLSLKFFVTVREKLHINIYHFQWQDYCSTTTQTQELLYKEDKLYFKPFLVQTLWSHHTEDDMWKSFQKTPKILESATEELNKKIKKCCLFLPQACISNICMQGPTA